MYNKGLMQQNAEDCALKIEQLERQKAVLFTDREDLKSRLQEMEVRTLTPVSMCKHLMVPVGHCILKPER